MKVLLESFAAQAPPAMQVFPFASRSQEDAPVVFEQPCHFRSATRGARYTAAQELRTYGLGIYYPDDGEANGKENGKCNGNWV